MTKSSLVPLLLLFASGPANGAPLVSHEFVLSTSSEVIATITAGCASCDWGQKGHEAALLEVSLDGAYSQHVALVRGSGVSAYRILLGGLSAGPHRLSFERDERRSAPQSGPVVVGHIEIESFAADTPESIWLAHAPFLRARPGSVERFSDVPLLMYAERNVSGEGGRYQEQYTVVFSHEDGGTPADRLMATWGRTTDIEFIVGVVESGPGGRAREMFQAEGHQWMEFKGRHLAGRHPELWVSTDNNMVAADGPENAIRFAPAPRLVALGSQSREAVMDAEPWTYAVTAAEMAREGRINPSARPRSGLISDPRNYAVIEACADVDNAALAFDVGVRVSTDDEVRWFSTDRGEPSFRIARAGCFRAGAPLSPGIAATDVVATRVRAYRRPRQDSASPAEADGHVRLQRVNRVFVLDDSFTPTEAAIHWTGDLSVALEGPAAIIPR